MKILVLAEDYIKDGNYALLFVHTRNLEYLKKNIKVDVINFREKGSYVIDGIDVFGVNSFSKYRNLTDYDLILSHAPNIKNHFRFIFKNLKSINKVLFFIHGHEVLLKDKYYPKPFFYQKGSRLKGLIHFIYDRIKVQVFKYFISFLESKKVHYHFVFVSKWMEDEFYKCVSIKRENLRDRTSIIHNPVNQVFIDQQYNPTSDPIADFVTIRPFDGPKYAVDLVYKLAKDNPQFKFTLYGKGEFFKYHESLANLNVIEKFLNHSDIPEVLNQHRGAIMLTRLDAQGVMACEIACYGIPLITSDIELKRELLGSAKNVNFLKNDLSQNLGSFDLKIGDHEEVKEKFSSSETLQKEIDLMKKIVNSLA